MHVWRRGSEVLGQCDLTKVVELGSFLVCVLLAFGFRIRGAAIAVAVTAVTLVSILHHNVCRGNEVGRGMRIVPKLLLFWRVLLLHDNILQ